MDRVLPYNVSELANRTADRIRGKTLRPNAVVDTVLRENHVPGEFFESARHKVLSELAKRSAVARRAKKSTSETRSKDLFQEMAERELAREMDERSKQANEHICPLD